MALRMPPGRAASAGEGPGLSTGKQIEYIRMLEERNRLKKAVEAKSDMTLKRDELERGFNLHFRARRDKSTDVRRPCPTPSDVSNPRRASSTASEAIPLSSRATARRSQRVPSFSDRKDDATVGLPGPSSHLPQNQGRRVNHRQRGGWTKEPPAFILGANGPVKVTKGNANKKDKVGLQRKSQTISTQGHLDKVKAEIIPLTGRRHNEEGSSASRLRRDCVEQLGAAKQQELVVASREQLSYTPKVDVPVGHDDQSEEEYEDDFEENSDDEDGFKKSAGCGSVKNNFITKKKIQSERMAADIQIYECTPSAVRNLAKSGSDGASPITIDSSSGSSYASISPRLSYRSQQLYSEDFFVDNHTKEERRSSSEENKVSEAVTGNATNELILLGEECEQRGAITDEIKETNTFYSVAPLTESDSSKSDTIEYESVHDMIEEKSFKEVPVEDIDNGGTIFEDAGPQFEIRNTENSSQKPLCMGESNIRDDLLFEASKNSPRVKVLKRRMVGTVIGRAKSAPNITVEKVQDFKERDNALTYDLRRPCVVQQQHQQKSKPLVESSASDVRGEVSIQKLHKKPGSPRSRILHKIPGESTKGPEQEPASFVQTQATIPELSSLDRALDDDERKREENVISLDKTFPSGKDASQDELISACKRLNSAQQTLLLKMIDRLDGAKDDSVFSPAKLIGDNVSNLASSVLTGDSIVRSQIKQGLNEGTARRTQAKLIEEEKSQKMEEPAPALIPESEPVCSSISRCTSRPHESHSNLSWLQSRDGASSTDDPGATRDCNTAKVEYLIPQSLLDIEVCGLAKRTEKNDSAMEITRLSTSSSSKPQFSLARKNNLKTYSERRTSKQHDDFSSIAGLNDQQKNINSYAKIPPPPPSILLPSVLGNKGGITRRSTTEYEALLLQSWEGLDRFTKTNLSRLGNRSRRDLVCSNSDTLGTENEVERGASASLEEDEKKHVPIETKNIEHLRTQRRAEDAEVLEANVSQDIKSETGSCPMANLGASAAEKIDTSELDSLSTAVVKSRSERNSSTALSDGHTLGQAKYPHYCKQQEQRKQHQHQKHARPDKVKLSAVQAAVSSAVASVEHLCIPSHLIMKSSARRRRRERDNAVISTTEEKGPAVSELDQLLEDITEEVHGSDVNPVAVAGELHESVDSFETEIDGVVWEDDILPLDSVADYSAPSEGKMLSNVVNTYDNGHDSFDTLSQSCQTFEIPVKPSGRHLQLLLHTTWGDPHYVGLAGVEIFDCTGRIVTFKDRNAQIRADPADVNVLLPTSVGGKASALDPRTVDKLIDGVPHTCDDLHQWLAPFRRNKNKPNSINFDLISNDEGEVDAVVQLGMVRIWNYNKSRTHSYRGVRLITMLLDGTPIFHGEVRQAPGTLKDDFLCSCAEPILFTLNAAALALIEDHDRRTIFESDAAPMAGPRNVGDKTTNRLIEAAANLVKMSRPTTGDSKSKDWSGERNDTNAEGKWLRRIRKPFDRVDPEGALLGEKQFPTQRPTTGATEPSKQEPHSNLIAIEMKCNDQSRSPELIASNDALDELGDAPQTYSEDEYEHYSDDERSEHEAKFEENNFEEKLGNISNLDITNRNSGKGCPQFSADLNCTEASKPSRTFSPRNITESLSSDHDIPTKVPDTDVKASSDSRPGIAIHNSWTLPRGRLLKLRLLKSCGDPHYLGITRLAVYLETRSLSYSTNKEGVESKIDLVYSSSLWRVSSSMSDGQNPMNIIQGKPITSNEHKMWSAPFEDGDSCWLELDLGREEAVWGLKFWNYNASRESVDRGVGAIAVTLDGQQLSLPSLDGGVASMESTIYIRRGPGHNFIDFGQTIPLCLAKDDTSHKMDKIQKITRSQLRYVVPAVHQDYEPCILPSGMLLRFVFHSSWGDPYYIGLDKLQIMSVSSSSKYSPLVIRGEQVAAGPISLQCLPGMQNDGRVPRNLFECCRDGQHATRGGWLAPLAASLAYDYNSLALSDGLRSGHENELHVLMDQPTIISGIRIWNYSKTPKRGVREVSVYLDDRLIIRSGLHIVESQRVIGSQEASSSPSSSTHQCLLFSNDSEAVQCEKSHVIYGGRTEQDVLYINDGEVRANSQALYKAPDPSAPGIWDAQGSNLMAKRPKTASTDMESFHSSS